MIIVTPQQAVESYLRQGGSLTVLECWQMFHTSELRRIISRIRPNLIADKFEIVDKKERYGDSIVKRYSAVKVKYSGADIAAMEERVA